MKISGTRQQSQVRQCPDRVGNPKIYNIWVPEYYVADGVILQSNFTFILSSILIGFNCIYNIAAIVNDKESRCSENIQSAFTQRRN